MNLTDNEKRVLEVLSDASDDALDITVLAESTGLGEGPAEQAAFLLQEKSLVEVEEETHEAYELTDEGEEYARQGLPERRIHDYLVENDGASVDRLRDEFDVFDIGIGHLRRKEWAEIDEGFVKPRDAPMGDDEEALEALLSGSEITDDAGEELADRNLAEVETVRDVTVSLTEDGQNYAGGGIEVEDKVGELTHEMLASGEWRDADFASYNVEADAERVYGGREHILSQLAKRVKEVLTSMGFKEMEGPHVDAEFYINDCLFMPQDHPARTHWDKFLTEEPTHIPADEIDSELMGNVERMH
ncbi:MAG: phenylalanine--tRNA ligase subunit alpha, partial [Halobacteria archaeon]|nr:phenylalanine--tRNA ligase subunit alpha [Halobacteria archaeon]